MSSSSSLNKEVDDQPSKRPRLSPTEEEENSATVTTVEPMEECSSSSPTSKKDKKAASLSVTMQPRPKRQPKVFYTTDEMAGITAYVGGQEGDEPAVSWSGSFKARFSDFHVTEISLDGSRVRLTDTTSMPVPTAAEEATRKANEPDPEAGLSSVSALVGAELTDQLLEYIKNEDNKHKRAVLILPPGADKEARTQLHMALRQVGGLNSTTISLPPGTVPGIFETKPPQTGKGEPCETFIAVQRGRGRDTRRSQSSWPEGRPQYLKFVLYKQNKDTMNAVSVIARLLKMNPKRFTYAGVKDRRAETVQEITAFAVPAQRLSELYSRLQGMAVGNFRYCDSALKLGDLQGNHFSIVLRNVTADETVIQRALRSVAKHGFVNYYGLQRFGNSEVATHHVGAALLRGEWETAVRLILQPSKDDTRPGAAILRQYLAGDIDAQIAASKLTSQEYNERTLLQALGQGLGSLNAFDRLSRGMRIMYVHGYQSYVWNRVASARLLLASDRVLEGDLVVVASSGDQSAGEQQAATSVSSSSSTTSQAQESGHKSNGKKGKEEQQVAVDDDDELKDEESELKAECIKVVAKGEEHLYSLHDVVLPTPGHSVQYPKNEIANLYGELMAEDGLDVAQCERSQKDFSLRGNYRRLVVIPNDVSGHTFRYDDPNMDLQQHDWNALSGRLPIVHNKDGPFTGATIRFSLPCGSYATMCLREIMRTPSSTFGAEDTHMMVPATTTDWLVRDRLDRQADNRN
mmetsp:Transcript_13678/g.41261  ORF Transcript_13678/g.41261 Transcript_13678/m.41261 type:complete len:746 (-) Transcript_13678:137-2374(-)|eukprot:CAMPEP_0174234796 /NCGR_PEP_ID=MMETSP0417-20130205/4447_1 /TAXON_ID=242541 /ORGANISM="Mayorella sp, Strain BSH-02190019" /LENGTH=745 /DNA_ID=CAMNT_0015313211 /DNA_START=7 /DNA_END=2244 /DNA_ORIENTATION=+